MKIFNVTVGNTNHQLCSMCKFSVSFLEEMQCILPIWFDVSGKKHFELPEELKDLTEVEKLLIQIINAYVPVHHLFKGQTGCKGHSAAFRQDIAKVARILPNLAEDVVYVQVIKRLIMQKEILEKINSLFERMWFLMHWGGSRYTKNTTRT